MHYSVVILAYTIDMFGRVCIYICVCVCVCVCVWHYVSYISKYVIMYNTIYIYIYEIRHGYYSLHITDCYTDLGCYTLSLLQVSFVVLSNPPEISDVILYLNHGGYRVQKRHLMKTWEYNRWNVMSITISNV